MYTHSASARDKSIKRVIGGAVLLAISIALCFSGSVILFLLGGILGLLSFISASVGLTWIIIGGEWKVSIGAHDIQWEAPIFGGGSFHYQFDDIECIRVIKRIKIKESGEKRIKQLYVIISRDGKKHVLLDESGVDLEKVTQLLKEGGVHEEVVEKVKHKRR